MAKNVWVDLALGGLSALPGWDEREEQKRKRELSLSRKKADKLSRGEDETAEELRERLEDDGYDEDEIQDAIDNMDDNEEDDDDVAASLGLPGGSIDWLLAKEEEKKCEHMNADDSFKGGLADVFFICKIVKGTVRNRPKQSVARLRRTKSYPWPAIPITMRRAASLVVRARAVVAKRWRIMPLLRKRIKIALRLFVAIQKKLTTKRQILIRLLPVSSDLWRAILLELWSIAISLLSIKKWQGTRLMFLTP